MLFYPLQSFFTMELPNLLAVLASAVASMVIGAVWYGPLFGKKWMALMGVTEEELKTSFNPLKTYGVTFLAWLLAAFVLAHIMQAYQGAFGVSGPFGGLQAGFWVWLGFVLTVGWQAVAYEDKPLPLYALNMGYNLLCLLTMGAIIGAWSS